MNNDPRNSQSIHFLKTNYMKYFFLRFTAAIALLLSTSFAVNAQPILDNTFSGDGYLLTKVSAAGDDIPRTVLIQSNGRILTGGNSFGISGFSDINIMRTKPNGNLDNSFGTAGIATIPGGFFCDMALLPGGKIIVAGSGVGPTNANNFIVYRLTKTGLLDTTFGNGGSVEVNIPNQSMICFDVVIQSDGKILLGGYVGGYANNDMLVVRLKANGNIDNTFATGGKFIFLQTSKNSECRQIALQADGKIIVGGAIDTLVFTAFLRYDYAALRLTTNGTLDNTFGVGGVVRANKADTEIATAVSVLSDGRIVLGGYSNFFGNTRFAALCLLPNGSFDTSFGTGGWSFSDFYGGTALCNALAVEGDDDIILAGTVYISAGASYQTIGMAKLLSNGAPDNTFGISGIDTSFYGTTGEGCNDIALQSDNKIVIAGYRYTGANSSYLIARYTNSAALIKQTSPVIADVFDVNIYPNPNSGAFVVTLSNPVDEDATITIINTMGQVVYADKFSSSTHKLSLSIALNPELADGIYYINIISGEQVITKQLVKQR
jgi:uncharacterized delta-60 repeat protein